MTKVHLLVNLKLTPRRAPDLVELEPAAASLPSIASNDEPPFPSQSGERSVGSGECDLAKSGESSRSIVSWMNSPKCVHFVVQYVAQPRDNSLASLLHEAFKLLELRFKLYDHDGAETLMFKELERQLALVGFLDQEKLETLFRRVDLDGNGTLDFAEFLCLLYLWVDKGNYSHFFLNPINAGIINKAFTVMEKAMIKYDKDRSRSLDIDELNAFFGDHLPAACQSGAYKQVVDAVFPERQREAGQALKFPSFMHLLYDVMCKYPGSTLQGTYSKAQTKLLSQAAAHATGEQSALWKQLREAFLVLQQDFNRFDANGDKLVDKTEITAGIPVTKIGADKVNIISRLEFAFSQVDLDHSNTLDFYEFVYLSFMMTQNGAYHDMVEQSTGATAVKRAFIDIHSYYRRFDEDKNLRLTWDELEKFFTYCFGEIPAAVPGIFAQVKYQSSATQGRDAVDVVRFMKLLYMLVLPDGEFVPNRYRYTKPTQPAESNLVSMPVVKASKPRPPRIEPVEPRRFRATKVLGQGGQGKVMLGEYEGFGRCAGKTLFGDPGPDLIEETRNEVDFFTRLDHPNCHYLLGAKLSLDNGGIMLLTEICELGSIYDFYGKAGKKFCRSTAWRLGKECALGLLEVHNMGFMHRDIKSLNVFLSSDLVAKVADFGMVTQAPLASDGCGTPQWMAPEVAANVLGRPTQYDRSVDVYSYGVLLWELFHCSTPFAETRYDQMTICKQVYYNGIRPRMSPHTPREIQKIIVSCWNQTADGRPTFDLVLQALEQAKQAVE